jgi:hypothetical protein
MGQMETLGSLGRRSMAMDQKQGKSPMEKNKASHTSSDISFRPDNNLTESPWQAWACLCKSPASAPLRPIEKIGS